MTKEEELLVDIQKKVKEYEQLKKEKEKKKQEKQKEKLEKEKTSQLATKEDLKELINKINLGKTGTADLQPQTIDQSVQQLDQQPIPPQTQQPTLPQPISQQPIPQQQQMQQPQQKPLTVKQQIALQIWRDSKATMIVCLIAIVFPMMSILIAMMEPQFALIISMVGIIYPCFILVKMISVQTRLHQKYGLRPLLQFRQQQMMYQQPPQIQQQRKVNQGDIML